MLKIKVDKTIKQKTAGIDCVINKTATAVKLHTSASKKKMQYCEKVNISS